MPTVTFAPRTSIPQGTETKVSNTDASQLFPSPNIAAYADGSYIVVWSILDATFTESDLYAQRYDASGTAVGAGFQLTTSSAGRQEAGTVAALSDGGFVVTWQNAPTNGGVYDIFAQRFDAAGLAVGAEFRVNTYVTSNQLQPAIASLPGGGYVILWSSSGQDGAGANSTSVHGQRFDASETAVGAEFRVNTYTPGSQSNGGNMVAALADGGFIVTWQSANQDGSGIGVYAQRYDATGVPQGSEFRVNTTTSGDQSFPTVSALSGGGFVIVWQSNLQDGSGPGVYAQSYDASGAALGGEFRVNSFTEDAQRLAAVTGLSDGGFVIAWQSNLQDGSNTGIYAQRYSAAGVALGSEFRVNSYTQNGQTEVTLAALQDGAFVIGWTSVGQAGVNTAPVYTQRFENGFTTGQNATLDLKGSVIVGDAESDPLTVTLSVADGVLTATAGTSGALVSGSGTDTVIISGTLAQVQAMLVSDAGSTLVFTRDDEVPTGSVALSVTVDDGNSAPAIVNEDILVHAANAAPVLVNPLVDRQSDEDQAFSFTIPADAFADPDGDTLTYAAQLTSGAALPTWLLFDAATRTFSGTPPLDLHATFSIRVYALDGALAVSDTFDFVINSVLDTIPGTSGNDTLNGTIYDDRIVSGGGKDTINAGDGNDLIVLDGPLLTASVLSGGNGTDTLELRNLSTAYAAPNGPTTLFQLFNSPPTSIERLLFASQSGTALSAQIVFGQVAAMGLTQIEGGAGVDTMLFVVTTPGTFTMPTLTRVNWTTPTSTTPGDTIALVVSTSATSAQNFTLNASVTHSGIEALIGGASNDTLNGSEYAEYLDGRGGVDQLRGFGGDDVLAIINNTPNTAPNTPGITTTFTGAGSLYDGGSGTDTLSVGGYVVFGGTLAGIERIFLLPPVVSTNVEIASQAEAELEISAATMASLPGNLSLDGNGYIYVILAPGNSFSGANYSFETGANVLFQIYGSTANDTMTGTSHNDVLDGRNGNDTISGLAGHDRLIGGSGASGGSDILDGGDDDDYITGGAGNDTIIGGNGFDRAGYFTQTGGVGATVDLRITIAQDTIIAGMDTLSGIEAVSGTVFADTLIGDDNDNWLWGSATTTGGVVLSTTNNDVIDGQGGNDLISVGIGNHVLNGGSGDDTLGFSEGDADGEGPLTVSLALQGGAQTTGAGSWTISNFENLAGASDDDHLTGDGNANRLYGAGGNDTLIGGGGIDTLYGDGSWGANTHGTGLSGAAGIKLDPTVVGDDYLDGGTGADAMYGGAGNDIYIVDDYGDEVFEEAGEGTDLVRTALGFYEIEDNVENVEGTGSAQTLRGNTLDNLITAGSGNDYLIGGAGNDTLTGGAGMDRAGYYTTTGGLGITVDLRIVGVAQDTGSQGMDTLLGIENLSGTPFADTLTGDDGNNWLWGSPATIGVGNTSAANNDTIDGQGGNDLITVGIGNHHLDGGIGNDTLRFTENGGIVEAGVIVSLAAQSATVAQATGYGSWILQNFENLSGGQGNDQLTGDGDDNRLYGDGGDDTLIGGGGSDTLYGDAKYNVDAAGIGLVIEPAIIGNDFLDGGAGADLMYGGRGDDTYIVDNDDDSVIEYSSEGTDEVRTALSFYQVEANVENLTGMGSGQYLRGNGLNNAITAGTGDDYLVGGAGNDTLTGGGGIDRAGYYTATGGVGATVDLRITIAQDTIVAGMDTLSGIENVSGTVFADTLTGDDGANWLWGSAATISAGNTSTANNDVIDGQGGDDLITVGIGNHVLDGGTGSDTLRFTENGGIVEAGIIVSLAAQSATVAETTGYGSWILQNFENLSGGQGNDQLTGDDNANRLTGEGGDDTLIGGGGDDLLSGDALWNADSGGNGFSGATRLLVDTTSTGNDSLDGGDGDDTALFLLEAGAGTLTLVADGADLLVKRGSETVARIVLDGEVVTVQGLGSAAHLGTDTLTNIEHLRFEIDGGGAPLIVNLSNGVVVDGYIAGGTVFGDANNNGVLDSGEAFTTTDANGNFTLAGASGPLVMFGGVNIDTGLANLVTLTAPVGSTVVNPLTTLVQALVESGSTVAAAQDAVATAFGIDTNVDLTSFDPLAAAPGDANALAVQQASSAVVVLVVAGSDAAGGGDANENSVFGALASAVSGGVVDLTNPTTVSGILTDALPPGTDVSGATQGISDAATAIDNSTTVGQVAAAQAEALNNPPAATAPANLAATEQQPLDLKHLMSVSDADAGSSIVTVTLSVGYGVLHVDAGTSGASIFSGNDGPSVVLKGTIAQLNALLGGDANSVVTYVANTDAPPATTMLTLGINDGGNSGAGGPQAASGAVTIAIAALDDPAVLGADNATVAENGTVSIAVLSNDSDPDDPLSVAQVNGMSIAVGQTVTLPTQATVTRNADGTLTYNPNGRFNTLTSTAGGETGAVNTSAPDSFTYTLGGGGSSTVSVTVNGVVSADDQLKGDAGNNNIGGTTNGDYFDLSQGGNDTANGLGGNDGFYFGAEFTADDQVDGGGGTNDQIGLEGNYANLILGANTIANVEAIVVRAGFSYNITTHNANVAAGGVLVVQATLLAAGQSLTFNGAAETNGSFLIYGGGGNDNLTGGAGDDGFYFGPGQFNASDTVNGGAGTNDQLGLDGNYTLALGGNVTNVEVVVLLPGPSGTPNTFNISVADVFVPATQIRTIFGTQVTTSITFSGANEHDGAFKIYGGFGNDTFTGSDGADWIFGGNGGDTMTGGLGADIFFYDAVAQSTVANGDIVLDFASGDRIDVSGIDALAGGGDDAFAFLGTGAFTNHAGELRVEDQGGNSWLVQADMDGDGTADFQLTLLVSDAHPLTATDFTF